ncbi:MAG TPA: porin, partial [Acidobacteriota bacterium]|nr:porin [Acidobacteriota bacterium]
MFWSSGSDTVNYSIRLTSSRFQWSPEHFLHLGFGYSRRQNTQESTEIKSRPESHLAPFLVDTGEFDSDSNDLFVPEVAWVRGPLSLQGEYFIEPINAPDYGNPTFQSGYAQVSYFLTGEHRNYSSEDGGFLAINPKRNFIGQGFAKGPGAWEVAARLPVDPGPEQRYDPGRETHGSD